MIKAILVKSASTGIGHHLAHYLAERRLLDANGCPEHNYSSDELIALLDEHLQARV
jgi:hypothetical protein